jgi:azurin
MSENAAIVARIIEHNTGGQNRATIDRNHIGVIATQHDRFDGNIDDSIAGALAEGYIEKQDGEYVAAEKVWDLVPGTTR